MCFSRDLAKHDKTLQFESGSKTAMAHSSYKYIPNTFEEFEILKKPGPVLEVVALEKWNKYLPST
jgi:hypothetical protein